MTMKEITLDEGFTAVLRSAGRAVMDVYRSTFSVEQKSDKSPVTLADRRSHEILTAFLKKHYLYPVLSEEGRDIPYEERRNWETFWLVDPLDGTKEFIKRNGEFTINVALIHQNRPVFGVVYAPAKDVLYHAKRGGGACRVERGKTQPLPLHPERDAFVVVGSRSHAVQEFEEYIAGVRERFGEVTLISAGSSLKFCLIAEGAADVYPRHGHTMEWDTAAGQAIVEEAGGSVINPETGMPLSYNKESLLNPYFVAYRSKEVWTSLHNRQS